MFVASQKRKENIAEYLLYMWQIEDIIRAAGLDIETIRRNIVDPSPLDDDSKRRLTEWYESIIDMMRREGVESAGHLQINRNVLSQLATLHDTLLRDPRFGEYSKRFYAALPHIVELRGKAGDDPKGEIETCFNALYGMLMLRLRGKELSEATAGAMRHISDFIALLSHYYRLDEQDELFKDNEN